MMEDQDIQFTSKAGYPAFTYSNQGYGRWLFICPRCQVQWSRKPDYKDWDKTPHDKCQCGEMVKAGF